MKESFIAVAYNIHAVPEDEEGKFFSSLGDHWGTGGAPSCFTPGGKYLGGEPEEASAAWKRLPPAERKPGRVDDLKSFDPQFPRRPAGSIVLKSYNRQLERDARGSLQRKDKYIPWSYAGKPVPEAAISNPEPGHAYLWLSKEKWVSLLPPQPRKGARVPAPRPVVDRLARHALGLTTYNRELPWAPGSLRSSDLTVTVEEVAAGSLKLRLEGSLALSQESFALEAYLLGYLDFDPRNQAFSRFDVVAVEKGMWDGRPSQAGQYHDGIAVVIELSRKGLASPTYDRILPGFYESQFKFKED